MHFGCETSGSRLVRGQPSSNLESSAFEDKAGLVATCLCDNAGSSPLALLGRHWPIGPQPYKS